VCQHANRADGTPCNGADCTHSNTCQGGVCTGTTYSCDDGEHCTTDVCLNTPPPNNCTHTLQSNHCWINNACVNASNVNPASPCTEQCQPTLNSLGWTAISGPCVITVAGNGTMAFADGAALSASFNNPMNVAVDSSGKVYIADNHNHRVRLLDGALVSTVAGNGVPGLINGPLATSQINEPHDVVVDATGAIYVADGDNNMIRRIASGAITTFAGKASYGYVDGPLLTAQFDNPSGIDVDSSGAFYVADRYNQRIRKIAGGQVTTIAGTGVAGLQDGAAATAQFKDPYGVAVDSSGAVYVADSGNHRIRKIAGGQVTTIAGSGTAPGFQDGPAATSLLDTPLGVAVDSGTGAVVFCDTYNHRIRAVAGGVVVTVAGDGNSSHRDGPVATARFDTPSGLAVSSSGVYVADSNNHRIRLIKP